MDALALFFQGLPYFVAGALGLLLPLLARWVYSSFAAGCGLIVIGLLQQTLLPGGDGINLGVTLYFMDMVTLIVAPVTLLRLAWISEARAHSPALLALLAVVAVNILAGLPTYGAGAGNAARADVYSLTALTYAMTFPADKRRIETLVRVLLWAASALFAIACFRWYAVAFQVAALLPESGSFQPAGHSVWRVIVSNEALVLVQAAVIGWFYGGSIAALRGWRLPALVLTICVIVLQHRSTWVAMLAAVAVAVAAMPRGEAAKRRSALVGLIAFVLAAVGAIVSIGGGVTRDVETSMDNAVELQGTAGARLYGWKELVEKWAGGGPRSLALGQTYGTGNERYVSAGFGARKIEFQAHNYYVTVLTSLGLVGFGAYLALWWQVGSGLYRAARSTAPAPEAALLLTLLAAQAAYYLTYGTDFLQALILGTGLSCVAARRRLARQGDAGRDASLQAGPIDGSQAGRV